MKVPCPPLSSSPFLGWFLSKPLNHFLTSVKMDETQIYGNFKWGSKQANNELSYPSAFCETFSVLLKQFSSQRWGTFPEVTSVQMVVKEPRDSLSFSVIVREEWLLPWLCGPDCSLSGWVNSNRSLEKSFLMVFLWSVAPGMLTISAGHHGDATLFSLPLNLLW